MYTIASLLQLLNTDWSKRNTCNDQCCKCFLPRFFFTKTIDKVYLLTWI